MKALSIKQPWASLILTGGKDIENRDWYTNFRGRVAVHASKGMTRSEYDEVMEFLVYEMDWMMENLPSFGDLTRGAILGTVDIVDCVTKSDSPWFFGPHGFVLRNPIVLPNPIPIGGFLSFWDVPTDIADRILNSHSGPKQGAK